MIPILNLTRQYEQLKDKINTTLVEVAASGQYILGAQVQDFENEMAQWMGVKHVIGNANGSDALFLALRALKIGAGDEVITTPFSFVATSESIVRAGATPVFADIDPRTFNLDVSKLDALVTPRTKAIMPVHIFGQPAEMDAILEFAKRHGIAVVEDCAQSIGALYKGKQTGTMGDIGCFSFFPSKNLGAMGDGGMMVTNDDDLAERLRMLRVHGSRRRYYHDEFGINSRLDALQAAVLRVKLPHLAAWNAARRTVAANYNQLLAPMAEFVETPYEIADVVPVYHQYTVKIKRGNRDAIQQKMQELGVQSMIYYPIPLYRQQTHAPLGYKAENFPVCEAVSEQVMSLPMFPEITEDEQRTVASALEEALKAQAVGV